jgi:hypothetical protein
MKLFWKDLYYSCWNFYLCLFLVKILIIITSNNYSKWDYENVDDNKILLPIDF